MDSHHIFKTEREVAAFMMGFHAAASEQVFVGVAADAPMIIRATLSDDDAERVWDKAKTEFNHTTRSAQ